MSTEEEAVHVKDDVRDGDPERRRCPLAGAGGCHSRALGLGEGQRSERLLPWESRALADCPARQQSPADGAGCRAQLHLGELPSSPDLRAGLD